MKLYAVLILQPYPASSPKDPVRAVSAVDVSSFGFFQRGTARELIYFLSRTVAKRVASQGAGVKTQLTENNHCCFALTSGGGAVGTTTFNNNNNNKSASPVVAIAISDMEYNSRVAFTLLTEVLIQFQTQFRNKYEYALTSPGANVQDDYLASPWPYLEDMLHKYQNPEEVDKILKIQKDIQETKTVMYNAIDQMLERGTTINDMVASSNDLSLASKTFYSQAKETNSGCCAVM